MDGEKIVMGIAPFVKGHVIMTEIFYCLSA